MTPDKAQIIQYRTTLDLVMLPTGLRIRDNADWGKTFDFKKVVYGYMSQLGPNGPDGRDARSLNILRLKSLSKDLHELASQCDILLQKIDPTPV
jgi:hypothetical protein